MHIWRGLFIARQLKSTKASHRRLRLRESGRAEVEASYRHRLNVRIAAFAKPQAAIEEVLQLQSLRLLADATMSDLRDCRMPSRDDWDTMPGKFAGPFFGQSGRNDR